MLDRSTVLAVPPSHGPAARKSSRATGLEISLVPVRVRCCDVNPGPCRFMVHDGIRLSLREHYAVEWAFATSISFASDCKRSAGKRIANTAPPSGLLWQEICPP